MQGEMVVEKLLEYIEKINSYCGKEPHNALCDKKTLEACVFNLSQMGEVVKHLSKEYESAHKDIPWRKIYGLRNKIVHDYEGINHSLMEEIIVMDLPELELKLIKILNDDKYRSLEISEKQIKNNNVQEARGSLDKIRKQYNI